MLPELADNSERRAFIRPDICNFPLLIIRHNNPASGRTDAAERMSFPYTVIRAETHFIFCLMEQSKKLYPWGRVIR
jgi:hypothetical protein